MKKLLIIAICLFGLSPFLKAQILNLNYQISLPMNKVKDFTDKTSFRGFDLEYHYFLGDRFSIGAGIGWNVFYQDKNNTSGDFTFSGNENIYTITGNQYRYINTVPMLAIGRYYFTDNNTRLRPYVGMGIGTCWTEKRLEVGQFASSVSRWQFALAPEIGMYIPVSDQFGFNIGAKYNYSTKAAHGRVPQVQSLTFNIGILLMGLQ
ncbi:MAG: OmpW family outer membrane protein [Odoribacter sp.]